MTAKLPLYYSDLKKYSPIPPQYRFLREFERRIINRLPRPDHPLELRQRAIASALLSLALAERKWKKTPLLVTAWLGGLTLDIGKGRIWRKYLELYPPDLPPEKKAELKRLLWDLHTRKALEIIRETDEATQKKVRPTPEEREILERVKQDITQHENVDGRHTPTGLVMVIADAYAAYSRNLPYRPKLQKPEERLNRIKRKYFHPKYATTIAELERLAPKIQKRFPIVEG